MAKDSTKTLENKSKAEAADTKAAFDLYISLMREIKLRLFAIDSLLRNDAGLPNQIVQESVYLQLRFCCETLAIACLVAHGDIDATKKRSLQSAYEADKIIKQMSELHPGFFPIPIMIAEDKGGIIANPVPSNLLKSCLSKDDVVWLWRNAGGKLHRGKLKNILSHKAQPITTFPKVTGWRDKFRNLLNQHRIANYDNALHYLIACNVLYPLKDVSGAISYANE